MPRAEGGAGTLRTEPKEVEACYTDPIWNVLERCGEGRNLLRPGLARRGTDAMNCVPPVVKILRKNSSRFRLDRREGVC